MNNNTIDNNTIDNNNNIRKEKVYYYRGCWYNSDLDEATDHELEISECITLNDNLDIVSLYHSDYFEDMHGLTAEQFVASPLYEPFV